MPTITRTFDIQIDDVVDVPLKGGSNTVKVIFFHEYHMVGAAGPTFLCQYDRFLAGLKEGDDADPPLKGNLKKVEKGATYQWADPKKNVDFAWSKKMGWVRVERKFGL